MDSILNNLDISASLPEICIGIMACVLLLVDLFITEKYRSATYYIALLTLFGALFLSLRLIGTGTNLYFFDSFIKDDMGHFLKFLTCFIAIFVFMYTYKYIRDHKIILGEYYALCLFSILGMMVLISSYSLLTLYLGVELLALPLYALIALAKDKRAPEAAMKYFVMGALASGLLLFGISLLYGATGSISIHTVAEKLMLFMQAESTSLAKNQVVLPGVTVLIGMVLVLIGLAFKLGVVPFHMWVPDIYEGSASSVTLFIATLPELAGFAMAIRLLANTFPSLVEHWQPLWQLMAVLSLALGNIVAIAQTNLKRMLAYSSIGHMGFVFLGLLAGPQTGYGAALAYILIYSITVLCAFGIMTALSYQNFEAEHITDFRGLGRTQPWIAFLMLLVMFSLAGIPPTVGFYAKFLVLNALVDGGFLWLAIVGVIFAVVGAFYYLRIVRMMFFDLETTEFKMSACQKVPRSETLLLSLNGLFILGLGIYPAPLINACLTLLPKP